MIQGNNHNHLITDGRFIMRRFSYFAILSLLILAVTGAFAADFTVPAPTGNPVTDTGNINAAITSALGDAGPNRVLLQSGAVYVLSATLPVSGNVKNVTFTTTGAGRATLVCPNYVPSAPLLGNSRASEGLFSCDVTNGAIGWDNLNLLPAPFSVTGATGAVGDTLAIGISPTSTTTTFRFKNLLITANDNSNAPVATDGKTTQGDLIPVNWTMFGVGCIVVGAQSNIEIIPGGADNEFYFDNFVGSLAGGTIFWCGRTSTDALRHQCGEVWEARNSVFSYSGDYNGSGFAGASTMEEVWIDGFANVRVINCYFDTWRFASSSRDTVAIWDAETVWWEGSYLTQSGIGKRYGLVLGSIQVSADIVDSTFFNGTNFLIYTRGQDFANLVVSCTNVYCASANNNGSSNVEAIDMTGDDGAGEGPGEVYMNNVTVENVLGGVGVQLGAAVRRGVFEDCTFRNVADSAIFTNVTSTGVDGATLEVRNCVIEDCALASAGATGRSAAICSRMGYNVIEDVSIRVAGLLDVGANTGIYTEDAMSVVIRNASISNANQAGIWLNNMRVLNEVAPNLQTEVGVLIEDCNITDCGSSINPTLDPPHTDLFNNSFRVAALIVDDGGDNTIRNCRIANSYADATYLFWDTATSGSTLVENIDFVNCRNNLLTLFALNPGTNSTSATVRDMVVDRVGVLIVPETDDDAGRTVVDSDPPAFYVRATTIELDNVTVLNNDSTAISLGSAASTQGSFNVHDVIVRDVTANGIEILGGVGNLLTNVEVINAVSDGITFGKLGVGAGISVDSRDGLCLRGNGTNLRIFQGDETKPPMALTNSTLLDSPVDISYETLAGQVLEVTDCIIAGQFGGGGTGIDVPTLVTDSGSGITPPRVHVWNSALVDAGDYPLATDVFVNALNDANTVTLEASVITNDPIFQSTTPGAAQFLGVRSDAFGGKGSGGSNLSGCGPYIGDIVGIPDWRRF